MNILIIGSGGREHAFAWKIRQSPKTEKLFTIEEGVLEGGFGSGVLELIIDKVEKHIIIKNIALPDKFIEHGDRQALLDKYGLSSKKIAEAIKKEWQR